MLVFCFGFIIFVVCFGFAIFSRLLKCLSHEFEHVMVARPPLTSGSLASWTSSGLGCLSIHFHFETGLTCVCMIESRIGVIARRVRVLGTDRTSRRINDLSEFIKTHHNLGKL